MLGSRPGILIIAEANHARGLAVDVVLERVSHSQHLVRGEANEFHRRRVDDRIWLPHQPDLHIDWKLPLAGILIGPKLRSRIKPADSKCIQI